MGSEGERKRENKTREESRGMAAPPTAPAPPPAPLCAPSTSRAFLLQVGWCSVHLGQLLVLLLLLKAAA